MSSGVALGPEGDYNVARELTVGTHVDYYYVLLNQNRDCFLDFTQALKQSINTKLGIPTEQIQLSKEAALLTAKDSQVGDGLLSRPWHHYCTIPRMHVSLHPMRRHCIVLILITVP